MTTLAASIEEFALSVVAENPMHANFLHASLAAMRAETRAELANYLAYGQSRGLDATYLAACYNTIVVDTLGEQVYFNRHRKYRCSTFREVADRVYFDDAYMSRYMHGLALSSFLWPNHVALHDFFRTRFPKGRTGVYLEIGPGHGYYFKQAAMLGNFANLVGVDLSATSIRLTTDILRHAGILEKHAVNLIEADFLDLPAPNQHYSCIVMGEVLEHVEVPARFLEKIALLCDAETFVFVTTCINAPAIDHIYLFESPAAVESMLERSGLQVVESCYAPYVGTSLDESVRRLLPVNAGYVLARK